MFGGNYNHETPLLLAMKIAKEWGFTFEQWEELSEYQKKRYLLFETIISKQEKERRKNKNG